MLPIHMIKNKNKNKNKNENPNINDNGFIDNVNDKKKTNNINKTKMLTPHSQNKKISQKTTLTSFLMSNSNTKHNNINNKKNLKNDVF